MIRKGELGKLAMWKGYKKKYTSSISQPTFVSILKACNSGMQELLLSGREIKLPHRLGTLFIEKKKVNFNHLSLDFGHWQKTGKKLYHLNRHSDNFKAHLHWRKLTAILPGKQYYKLTPARAFNRKLAQIMLTPDGHKIFQQYKHIK